MNRKICFLSWRLVNTWNLKSKVLPSHQVGKKLSVCFLGEVMARQFFFKIYWPLGGPQILCFFLTLLANFKEIWPQPHPLFRDVLKFGLSEKHSKFENIFLMVWTFTIVILQSMRKIAQISVCFSESLNFNWMVPMPVVLLICHRKSDILRRLLSNVKL